ncbi:MAG TPA: lysine 2,3-aminomutase [Persephonella sp.]|uniref:L-lysine 2,3-aminomutase n=1 Tax=Persephonella marina (strain DSM 14350 / EX-H1) TaxID=123214 RepID=C0QT11_PERMH|nr:MULTISPECIES: lysine 2,3-aminomutase [Persephonella]ACO04638.1 L-lysine 2,3-aminomutase [Persephonella marina EX-H1]HCB70555.1 lysine 2,3-aminomutase [Persephonella sp.]
MRYRSYTVKNFRTIPQVEKYLTEKQKFDIEVVGQVFPFKVNNYVIDQLINWEDPLNDPIFRLTFPQKDMLFPEHYELIARLLKNGEPQEKIREEANRIRMELNPHPAGQKYNVPEVDGIKLHGAQHKYKETILFFPKQGQTCHAYCSFCFRWPQFVGINELKFAMKEVDVLIEYIKRNPEITDILFTGGDPLIMKTSVLKSYIQPVLEANIPHLKTIRIGTKSLGFWPYRFTEDEDAQELLDLFRQIVDRGYHLAFMAHFNHYKELRTDVVREAVDKILETGAVIRTQSPVLRHINDSSEVWATMWKEQVSMGMIPYYMFMARDTGAQHYFGVPLVRAWNIFRDAYKKTSGLARTVKGPSMSATPGKVRILGVSEIFGEKVMVLDFLQGRNPDWVGKPFFAKYDENAMWLDELEPVEGEEFFYEKELREMLKLEEEKV